MCLDSIKLLTFVTLLGNAVDYIEHGTLSDTVMCVLWCWCWCSYNVKMAIKVRGWLADSLATWHDFA